MSIPPAVTSAAEQTLGHLLPLASVAPFVLLLLAIALLPLAAGHWWERNKNRAIVSLGLGGAFTIWLLTKAPEAGGHALHEAALDYVSFIALLASLYVISGGIFVRGSLAGTPLSNVVLLSIGAVLANFIGTTGASMVLIRPYLRANRPRTNKRHLVVFFIFVVSNCAGLLTPLGDPPLFLGFLKGVPFAWTLSLWREWLAINAGLLLVFFFYDSRMLDKEELERPGSQLEEVLHHGKLGLEGAHNLFLLLGIVLVILAKGQGWGHGGEAWPFGWPELAMVLLTATSWFSTHRVTHQKNHFSFAPIVEVAILFAGIFATMVAPLALLNAHGAELGIAHPAHYFWASGVLSSFLDNAPTYLTFAAVASGQAGIPAEGSRYLAELLARGPEAALDLAAISCGAVMMGANTYIGNGPNFMVKAIAEHSGVKMPSFFGYMGWSIAVLLPLLVVITFVFFA